MAADRAKTTLMIALIIFVMIAFILSVTTYLGFQQKVEQQKAAESARADMEKANRERDAALDQVTRIREVLGSDKDSAEAVETERNELFDRKFAGFDQDPKTLLRLVEWLDDAIRAKDGLIDALDAEKKKILEDKERAVAEALKAKSTAEEDRDRARAELQSEKEKFDQQWAAHENAQKEMRVKQDQALADAERMKAITEELAKLGPLLSPDLRRKFAATPQDQPEPWPERVRFVLRELLDRQKTIQQLNATLATLRVADPKLQELVRESTPDDDRIDGFDGRIASVNAFDRTVLLVCDSTAGMRPGLVLSVFDPDDPRPRSGTRKGLVEIVEVEGPTLARARIREDSTTTPLLAGDGVATSLWAADGPREVALVGFVRFGAGRQEGTAALEALVERSGGRVVDTVTPLTTLVVDAGIPQSADVQAGLAKDWKPVDETVRRKALERAKESGIRVVSLDGLLDMLGIDREAIDGRRLPHELGAAP